MSSAHLSSATFPSGTPTITVWRSSKRLYKIGMSKQCSVFPDCVGPVATNRFQPNFGAFSSPQNQLFEIDGLRAHENRRDSTGPDGMMKSCSANSRMVRSRGTRI